MLYPDLVNKNVILTGCNRGIGKETLTQFSNNGSNCFACIRKNNSEFTNFCKTLEKKNKKKIHIVEFDLLNIEEIKEGLQKVFSVFDKIDVLVNNAGIVKNSLFLMTSQKDLQEMFQINFFSQDYLTQLVSKKMITKKSGNIIFLSSSSAKNADFGRFSYSCSKSSIETLSKTLSKELASYNIRVNSVSPGLVNTSMTKNFIKEKELKNEINKTLAKKMADTQDVTNLILFLASSKSNYINGSNLPIDSGL